MIGIIQHLFGILRFGGGAPVRLILSACLLVFCATAPGSCAASLLTVPGATSTLSAEAGSETDLNNHGFVDSSDGVLRVAGRANLLLSLQQMTIPPAAPTGWDLVTPVFDIAAHDRARRPVSKLSDALALRFAVSGQGPFTVLVHNGQRWEVVPSEIDEEGRLSASVNHLTPYTVGVPAAANPRKRVAPSASALPTGLTPIPASRATASASPAAAPAAQAALTDAVKALKGRNVKVSGTQGYTGSLYIAVPPALQSMLQSATGGAVGGNGHAYYGLYNAVNEAITVQALGNGVAGSLTLLLEPKTNMPASADEARNQLAALFPGVAANPTQVQSTTGSYMFYCTSGSMAYSLGYLQYSGLIVAYVLQGTGSSAGLVRG